MKSILRFITKNPILTLVIVVIMACVFVGPRPVARWLGHTTRGAINGAVTFVRAL